MAVSTEIVGREFGPFVREYTFRDLEICALGCNAGFDGKTDLLYINEGDAEDPHLKPLPIFAVPLTVNEEMTRTLDYGYDYSGSLHYGIDVRWCVPFAMEGRVETYVTQDALYDHGEGRGCLSRQTGLERPVAHGVAVAGLTMRHLISTCIPGEPERLRRFKTRFTSPVLPGSNLQTRIWVMGDKRVHFQLVDADFDTTGSKPHLNFGVAEWD